MKSNLSALALAAAAAIVLSACTTRETRIVQPAVVAPAGSTVIVPNRDTPDVIVDVD